MLGLLKRLFGGSKRARGRATPQQRRRSATGEVLAQTKRPAAAKPKSGEDAGFDPYNTGKFDRAASWERVRHSHR